MAFGAKKIFPLDTKPNIAIGVNIPFNGPAVFNSTYYTADAIKANMLNFFLTNLGERYMNPLFGGNLRKFVFEQIATDNIDTLKLTIRSIMTTYFPSVKIDALQIAEVTTEQDIDSQTVIVKITYSVVNTGITDNLEIEFT